ncbi:MAG: TonB-dependent receptor [Gracilimonas sp.]
MPSFGSAHIKTGLTGKLFGSILSILIVLFLSSVVFAQDGTIRGEVTELETGETLVGANVIVEGTAKGASTDIDGRYVIRNVPAGDYTLLFRYLGFESKNMEVTVEAGESIQVDMQMSATTLQGEEIQVTAFQRGQSRALSEQRKSVNIKNVISSEQIEAFADNTVTGALSRIAGMGHGGTNIRGVGAGATNVTMDGQRMGATGSNRSVDLSTISADMVQDLEVIKVITPDMDADALAGVININTRRPIGGERSMNIRLGGGVQDRYLKHTGTMQRASVSYGNSPNDRYSFGLNFSYQRDPSADEQFRTEWQGRAFVVDNEPSKVFDILSSVNSNLDYNIPERIGTGAQFTFQPSDISTYHVQGMFNFENRSRYQYGISYNPRMQNYTQPTYTGDPDGAGGADAENQGTIQYNPRLDDIEIQQYTVQAGGRHRLDQLDLEYKLGWGHGRYSDDQYRMNFETNSNYEFIFDTEDRWNPNVDIAPWSRASNPVFPRTNEMFFQEMDHRINNNVDNDIQASVDMEIPYQFGDIKTGLSSSLTFKRGVGEQIPRQPSTRMTVANFKQIENGAWEIFDRSNETFHLPWLIDLDNARDFYLTQSPRFTYGPDGIEEWAQSTETSRYFANENTYAAYAMSNFRVGPFTLLGGLRVEHTYNYYSGREGRIDNTGWLGATDINSSNSYTNFFPNLQTVFAFGQMTNLRLAYSRSIGRPNFNQLNPYIMRNEANKTIQQGNPKLSPMLSNNFDVLFEHYFLNVGQFTIGLFYKDMKDFVFSYSEPVNYPLDNELGLSPGRYMVSGFRNGEQATVYGAEFMWQQNLEFLPGILGNLGTYVNYSYAQSIADVGRGLDEQSTHGLAHLFELVGLDGQFDNFQDYKNITPLEGQRPHVVNAGLDFSKGEFFTQVSYQWAAPSISSYGSNAKTLIASPREQSVYFDQFNGARQNLSLTARYWISDHFQVWFDASNILNHKEVSYFYDEDYYPYSTDLSGREITLGLRYQL